MSNGAGGTTAGRPALAARLTLAFVGVTLLAIAIVASLALVLGKHRIDVMVEDRRTDLVRSLQANAVATYNSGERGWTDADWQPALDLAARYGTNVEVLDGRNRVIASTPISPTQGGTVKRSPIMVGPEEVGTLVVSFTGGLKESANDLRRSLIAALVGATGLAALAALVAALAVSRRLARPLVVLMDAADAMRRGSRDVRVGPLPGSPRELQDLGETFDAMADSLNRQEELRRALVSEVAHELRTPVAVLQANLEALLDGVVENTPAQTESLHEEVLRLADRVEDLQALARADAAALSMNITSVDLSRVAAAAVEQLAGQVNTAGVEVRTQLLPAEVQGDPVRLHQVVTNLLVNACKFTPPGGRVEVEVSPGDDDVRLVVRDTGVGIAPEDLPYVFERFRRGTRTAEVPGSGIGLAIVARLVSAHGGSVGVDSRPGAGTEVTVRLPYEGQRSASSPRR